MYNRDIIDLSSLSLYLSFFSGVLAGRKEEKEEQNVQLPDFSGRH